MPTSVAAASSSFAPCAAAARRKPTTATIAARTIHSAVLDEPERSNHPWSDWLLAKEASPTRSVRKTTSVQKRRERSGRRSAAPSQAPAAVATATKAGRHRLVTTQYTMKIPGVTFTAVARPTSVPRGRRVRSGTTSAREAAINRIPN
jgi:hypothetical protein